MAGGIDWFRWHHGSLTDPKFALIAKKSGVRLGDVIAIWAHLLEQASMAEDRGHFGEIDEESIELLLDLDEGQCAKVLDAMTQRGLVSDGSIANWHKRQPKRERDDNSIERVRAFRERQKLNAKRHETPSNATKRHVALHETQDEISPKNQTFNVEESACDEPPCNAMKRQESTMKRHVTPEICDVTPEIEGETPSNATKRQETPRGEERREEKKEQPNGCLSTSDEVDRRNRPACPHQKLIALYAERLPGLRQPNLALWDGERAQHMRSRWNWVFDSAGATTEAEALAWFDRFFVQVSESKFLTGQTGGDRPFQADLGWLMRKRNFAKVVEGNYTDGRGVESVPTKGEHRPQWALNAGYRNRYEAEADGCTERTSHLFHNGIKIDQLESWRSDEYRKRSQEAAKLRAQQLFAA